MINFFFHVIEGNIQLSWEPLQAQNLCLCLMPELVVGVKDRFIVIDFLSIPSKTKPFTYVLHGHFFFSSTQADIQHEFLSILYGLINNRNQKSNYFYWLCDPFDTIKTCPKSIIAMC